MGCPLLDKLGMSFLERKRENEISDTDLLQKIGEGHNIQLTEEEIEIILDILTNQ